MEHITLYYRQGSSDKVYQASLEPADGGHVVRFAYGRRGATLQTGTKTQKPVAYDEARRIYDKLVAEKNRQRLYARRQRHAGPTHGKGQSKHRHSLPVAQRGRGRPGGTADR